MVELAALDSLQTPIEKLVCLRTCLDLVRAQVKAALVDFQSITYSEGILQTFIVPRVCVA